MIDKTTPTDAGASGIRIQLLLITTGAHSRVEISEDHALERLSWEIVLDSISSAVRTDLSSPSRNCCQLLYDESSASIVRGQCENIIVQV